MVFPDEFTWPTSVTEPTANINGTGAVSIGTYTAAQWTLLEANGAVFLPTAGFRVAVTVSYAGVGAGYWTSTRSSGTGAQYLMFYNDGGYNWNVYYSGYGGFSVRLVCE